MGGRLEPSALSLPGLSRSPDPSRHLRVKQLRKPIREGIEAEVITVVVTRDAKLKDAICVALRHDVAGTVLAESPPGVGATGGLNAAAAGRARQGIHATCSAAGVDDTNRN
jgi:hypothetical protein